MWACMFSECIWIKTFFNLILMVVFHLFWSSLFTAWLHCNVTHLVGQSSTFESRRKCLDSSHPATSPGQIFSISLFQWFNSQTVWFTWQWTLQPHSASELLAWLQGTIETSATIGVLVRLHTGISEHTSLLAGFYNSWDHWLYSMYRWTNLPALQM